MTSDEMIAPFAAALESLIAHATEHPKTCVSKDGKHACDCGLTAAVSHADFVLSVYSEAQKGPPRPEGSETGWQKAE